MLETNAVETEPQPVVNAVEPTPQPVMDAAPRSEAATPSSMAAGALMSLLEGGQPGGQTDSPMMWAMLAYSRREGDPSASSDVATDAPPASSASETGSTAGGSARFAAFNSQTANPVVTDTVHLDGYPNGLAVSPDGTRAYVVIDGRPDGLLTVIDTATNTPIGDPIRVGFIPQGAAVSPDGSRLYVTSLGDGTVSVLDTATRTVIATFGVGRTASGPWDIAVTPDGTRAYVANFNDNSVLEIDTATNAIVGDPINVGLYPTSVTVSPDGTRVYTVVLNNTGTTGLVSVIDTATHTVVGSPIALRVNDFAQRAAVSPDGTWLYVTSYVDGGAGSVTVVDTSTNTTIGEPIAVGEFPADVAFSPDGSRAYVTNQGDGTVSVIDTATRTVIGFPIVVGAGPKDLAVTPNGTRVYVVNRNEYTVSVISLTANLAPVAGTPTFGSADPATGAVSGSVTFTDPDGDALTYSVTTAPTKGTVVVRPDGTFTYTPTGQARLDAYLTPGSDVDSFAISAADGTGGSTSVAVSAVPVTPAEAAVTATLNISSAHGVVISPDSTRAYVASLDGTVSVVDTSTGAVVATINVGGLPRYPAITPDGAHVYVANQSGNVAVIDTATNTVTSSITIGEGAFDVTINRDGSRAYVTNVDTGTLSVIDTASNTVTATITVTPDVRAVALSPDGTRAYVTDPRNGLVIVDTTTNTVIDTIVSGGLQYVAVSPDGTRAYVSKFNNYVSVIDTSTHSEVSLIDVGPYPNGIVINRDGSRVYVTTVGDNTVKVIDTTTNTVTGTVPVGNFPIDVAVSPNGAFAYVTNTGAGTVSVITFANRAPTLTVTQVGDVDPTTGAVTYQAIASDPDGDPLTYGATAGTAKGFVTPNAEGTYTYTPSDYARHAASADSATPADKTDAFFITVTDPSGASASVTTTVVVNPKNAAPSGGMSGSTVDSSTGVVTGTFRLGDEDGDVLSYSGTADTAKGHLTVDPDGTFVFTPTASARHAASSDTATPADQMDVVSFVANDGHGGIVTAQVNVPVLPENVAPTSGTTTSVFNGTNGATTGFIGAVDADSDVLSYRLTGNAARGTVTVNSDGTYTYTTTAANRHLAAADNATAAQRQDTFTVSVDDAHGGVTPLTVTTQISPQNAAPTITLTQSGGVNATTGAVTYNVTARDADGDPLTYAVTANPAKGAVIRNTNGSYTYTPTAAARHDAALATATPAQKQDGFAVTVTDAHGGTTAATATPTISPKNASPTVTLTQIGTANTSTGALTYQINGSDPDGDTLRYSVTTGPAKGVAVVNADGTLTYTPGDASRHAASATNATTAQKQDTFTLTANDAHGASVSTSVRVTVSPRNAGPAVSLSQVGGADATTGAVTFAANGTDPDGDALAYTVTANAAKGRVVRNTDGTFTYTPTAAARHDAAADNATAAQKQDTFTVTVNDAHGGTTTATATAAITPKNATPTITLTQSGGANATTGSVTYTVTARDADGDPLTYAVTSTPAKGTVVRNTNGSYTYTPTAAARHDAALTTATPAQKQDTFTITVTDAHGGTTTATATPTINPKNTVPTGSPAVSAPNAAGVVTGTVGSSDSDGDSLTYSVTAGPGKGTVTVNPNGSFAYTPTAVAQHAASADNAPAAQKRDTFTVAVSDGHGGSQNVTVTAQVAPKNTGPGALPSATNPSISTGSVSGSVGGSDQDGDSLVYAVTSRPTKGTLVVNPDGTLTYTPTAAARTAASRPNATAAQKQDTFSVSVKDGHGGTTIVTYTVPLSLTSSGGVVIVVNPPASTI